MGNISLEKKKTTINSLSNTDDFENNRTYNMASELTENPSETIYFHWKTEKHFIFKTLPYSKSVILTPVENIPIIFS